MDKKTHHLEIIHSVAIRLAKCSVFIKGWSLVLISALFALAAKDSKLYLIYLAYFPGIVCWGLDGYILWQESLFRKLYDKTMETEEGAIDFSMDTTTVQNDVDPWICVTFSKPLIAFHGVVVGIIIIVMFGVIGKIQKGG